MLLLFLSNSLAVGTPAMPVHRVCIIQCQFCPCSFLIFFLYPTERGAFWWLVCVFFSIHSVKHTVKGA